MNVYLYCKSKHFNFIIQIRLVFGFSWRYVGSCISVGSGLFPHVARTCGKRLSAMRTGSDYGMEKYKDVLFKVEIRYERI